MEQPMSEYCHCLMKACSFDTLSVSMHVCIMRLIPLRKQFNFSEPRTSSGQLTCDDIRAETRFRLSEKWTVHLNLRGCQFSRLLEADVCASAVVILNTPRSEVV